MKHQQGKQVLSPTDVTNQWDREFGSSTFILLVAPPYYLTDFFWCVSEVVIIPDCHSGAHGFDSRTHRNKLRNKMKTLLEHINNSIYKENLQYHLISEQKYQDMLEFFDNDIPNDILERFKNGEDVDYILENLKSHDIDSLIKRLYKEFPIDNIEKFGEGCFIVWFV